MAQAPAAMPEILLDHPRGAQARISPEGAQLLSWRNAEGREQLYLSPGAQPAPRRAVRGGTPVCFPQFAERGPLMKHGFARLSTWQAQPPTIGSDRADEAVAARFLLDGAGAPPEWPHAFDLQLAVRLGADWMELELAVANTGSTPFSFTAALHTYLRVTDARQVELSGLQSCRYEDALEGFQVRQENEPAVRFPVEVDRVYLDTPAELRLQEPGAPERRIGQQGFTDTVVWNPGPAKAARLGDMPPDDWTRMLCVEAGVIGRPVQLEPGERWSGIQRLE
jgi:glucose-6-phosphate 1-epimerase